MPLIEVAFFMRHISNEVLFIRYWSVGVRQSLMIQLTPIKPTAC